MMSFHFHPDARRQLRRTVRHLEREQSGLGRRFRTAVDATLAKIRGNPDTGITSETELRLVSVKQFPYWIVFANRPGRVHIIAIHHERQDHSYWEDRLADIDDEEH